MGWRTRTSALPTRDLHQIVYLLPMWGEISSGVVFLWRRLICPQNSSLRMFWYRDLNSSHFFPRFSALEHEKNRTPDISATFVGSRKNFCKRKGMSVCPVRKRKSKSSSVPYRMDHFNRLSRGRTTPPSNFVPTYGPHLVWNVSFISYPVTWHGQFLMLIAKSQNCFFLFVSLGCPSAN